MRVGPWSRRVVLISYVYDEVGRLTGLVDPTNTGNGVAKYTYDDVGNLLQINRFATNTIRILDFHGKRGQAGAAVTIYGTAFNTTASQNEVRFGGSTGTVATVTAATSTTLSVTVPPGAPDGRINAKNLGTGPSPTTW